MGRKRTTAEHLGDGGSVVEVPSPPESKEARFIRLAKRRLDKAQKEIERLAPLANTSQYAYAENQVQFLIGKLMESVDLVKNAFAGKKRERPTLQFPSPEMTSGNGSPA